MRRVLLLATILFISALGLASCTYDDPVSHDDLVVDASGQVIVAFPTGYTSIPEGAGNDPVRLSVSQDSGQTWIRVVHSALNPDGAQTTACLPSNPSHCFQLAANAAVEESIDGGQTWTTSWDVDEDAFWYRNPEERSGWPIPWQGSTSRVEAMDLQILSDDTVLVAMADLKTIRRDPTGAWSPAVADFRQLDQPIAGQLLLSISVALLALALAFRTRLQYPRPLGPVVAFGMSFPLAVVCWIAIYTQAPLSWIATAVGYTVGIPMVFIACVALVVGVVQLARIDPSARPALAVAILITAVCVWAQMKAYQSWSDAGWAWSKMSWVIGALVVGNAAAAILLLWPKDHHAIDTDTDTDTDLELDTDLDLDLDLDLDRDVEVF